MWGRNKLLWSSWVRAKDSLSAMEVFTEQPPWGPRGRAQWCSLSQCPQPLGRKLCSLDCCTQIHEPAVTPILFRLPTCNSIKAAFLHNCLFCGSVGLPHLSQIYFSAFLIRCGLAEECLQWLLIYWYFYHYLCSSSWASSATENFGIWCLQREESGN